MASNLSNILAGAKKTLAKANAFDASIPGASQFAPKPTPKPTPVQAKPSFVQNQNEEASSVAAGLKYNKQNIEAAKKAGAIPKFHSGGKVKKGGLAILKKGETVRTKEQEKDLRKKIHNTRPKALLTKEEELNPVSIQHNSMPVAYFVRHGITDMNEDDKFRGDLDVPLNEDGEKQAQQLVSYFHNVTPSAIYYSSRSRTLQTIKPLADSKGMEPELLADLDSLNTGSFAGKPKDKKNEEQMQWYREHPDSKIPGGDVIRSWQNKVDNAITKVINKGEESGHPAIACIHGSVVKELSRFLHGDIKKAKVQPGGVVAVYKLSSGGYIAEPILKENDVDEKLHLSS
jgi:broad specificity phosphatase PhoE